MKASPLRGSLIPLRVSLDAVAIAAGLGMAVLLRFGMGWFEVKETAPTTIRAHVLAGVLWVAVALAAMTLNRLYDEDTLFDGGGEASRILRSIVEGGGVLSAFVFLTQSFYISRSWFALTLVFSMAFVASERLALRRFLRVQRVSGKQRRPAILVSRSETWEDWPFEEQHEFRVVARLAPDAAEDFLGGVDAQDKQNEMAGAAVVLRARDFSHDEFWRILLLAGRLGWSVFVHSPVRSVGRDRLTVRELAGRTIVKVAPLLLVGVRAAQKRVLDIAVSGLLLILASPFLVLIALSVLLSSGWPILFGQERVGREGKSFKMLKYSIIGTSRTGRYGLTSRSCS